MSLSTVFSAVRTVASAIVPAFSLSLFSACARATSREQVIYAFSGFPDCGNLPIASDKIGTLYYDRHFRTGRDGQLPYAGVIVYEGQLFGTTSSGGIYDHGTVFEVSLK